MFDYALRCIKTNYDELIYNAELLGIIDMIDGKPVEKNNGIWDEIGYKMIGPIQGEGQPDTRSPLTDNLGNEYVHINIRTTLDIDAIVRNMSETYPDTAERVSQFRQFFITGPDGQWIWPEHPLRVFL